MSLPLDIAEGVGRFLFNGARDVVSHPSTAVKVGAAAVGVAEATDIVALPALNSITDGATPNPQITARIAEGLGNSLGRIFGGGVAAAGTGTVQGAADAAARTLGIAQGPNAGTTAISANPLLFIGAAALLVLIARK